jgi:hypothetical protein
MKTNGKPCTDPKIAHVITIDADLKLLAENSPVPQFGAVVTDTNPKRLLNGPVDSSTGHPLTGDLSDDFRTITCWDPNPTKWVRRVYQSAMVSAASGGAPVGARDGK